MRFEMLDAEGLVYQIHGFLTPQECQAYITTSEAVGFAPAPITTAHGPVMAPEVRDNTRVMIDDPNLARSFWARLEPFVPPTLTDWRDQKCEAIGLNERFRFYRYDKKQRFARHYDGPYRRDNGETSLLTFMMYLNDGFQGGETNFYTDSNVLRFSVKPRAGTALIFIHNVYHEGARVIEGRKYVMRTDVMCRQQRYVLTSS